MSRGDGGKSINIRIGLSSIKSQLNLQNTTSAIQKERVGYFWRSGEINSKS